MRIILVIISIFIFQSGLLSQEVIITEDPAISAMMENYINWNKERDYVQGWRIQVINTDDRRLMESTLASFKAKFPEIGYVSWEQVSPYYKVKVGAYYSKIKAQAVLARVREFFPSAITVWEKIKESELIGK